MSSVKQSEVITLPEYTLDDLGTSFKVVLLNSVEQKITEEGRETFIPDYQGLMKQIALLRCVHPLKLSAGDIKFLRKNLGMKSKELAGKLDISPEHMSRCESADKVLSPNSEKVLRSLVLLEAIFVVKKALEDSANSDKITRDLIAKLTKLVERTREVMEGLTISPFRDADEELIFHLTLVRCGDAQVANDDDRPPEWHSNELAA